MDTTLSVSILREHSEHLRKLATDLSEQLAHLEQAPDEAQGPSETDAGSRIVELVRLNESLFAAADIFYHRLRAFLVSPRTTQRAGGRLTPPRTSTP